MLDPNGLSDDRRIEALIREVSTGLLEEALAEAREEVKASLRNELVGQIMREVSRPPLDGATEPRGAPRIRRPDPVARDAAVPPPTGRAVQGSGTACYLYGFTDHAATGVDGVLGIGDAPVEVVDSCGAGAVVSATDVSGELWSAISHSDPDIEVLRPLLEAHERVLEDLLDRGPVLPVRFGLTFADPEDIRIIVRDHARIIQESLETVRGKSEWSVTVCWEAGMARERVVASAAVGNERHSASAAQQYIHRRQLDSATASRMHELRARTVGDIHHRISRVACDSVVRRPDAKNAGGPHTPIFKAAYLVKGRDQERFRSALEDELLGHRELGMSADLTGPWPAYNFASLNLGEVTR